MSSPQKGDKARKRGGRGGKGKGKKQPGQITPLEFPPLPTFNADEEARPGVGGFVDRTRRGGGRRLVLPSADVDLNVEFDFASANQHFDKNAVLETVRQQEENGEIHFVVDDNTGRSVGVVVNPSDRSDQTKQQPPPPQTTSLAPKDITELQLSLLSGYNLDKLTNDQLHSLEGVAVLGLGRIRAERARRTASASITSPILGSSGTVLARPGDLEV